ncbi:hypothetical protein CEXT_213791 [Caerostris extrusa]|uniref:Uncharacterized protein n=1 Tax=Caerostris extrusa TaxID=172846 RepID=A0AAV4V6A9_CAEEX|nr:hypothetical protein CEXT_213791 [Caerostris extrusa]
MSQFSKQSSMKMSMRTEPDHFSEKRRGQKVANDKAQVTCRGSPTRSTCTGRHFSHWQREVGGNRRGNANTCTTGNIP